MKREWWIYPEPDQRYVFAEAPDVAAGLVHVVPASLLAEAEVRLEHARKCIKRLAAESYYTKWLRDNRALAKHAKRGRDEVGDAD